MKESINFVSIFIVPKLQRVFREVINGIFTLCLGVTFPSGDMQQRLVRSLYQEANISTEQVEYIEAHGTGTKVGQNTDTHTNAETQMYLNVY